MRPSLKAWLACVLVIFFTQEAIADVPEQLHYQGHLVNGAGEAVDCTDAFNFLVINVSPRT